jgi:hypothetical protein
LVTAADAAGPVLQEVSTGEVLQSASAEETADASEKLIRIVKEKTRMSAEIEVEHRGDVHDDVLRKMLDAFLQKFLVPRRLAGERGLGWRVDDPTERPRRYDTGWWFSECDEPLMV